MIRPAECLKGVDKFRPHPDKLGSTRALSKDDGTVAATYDYDAYGDVTQAGVLQPFQYAGQYTDPESGLQYLRARYYDPATKQFISRDHAVTMSRTPYAYAGGNPINAVDPSGLDFWGSLQGGMIQLGRALPAPARGAYVVAVGAAGDWAGREQDDMLSGDLGRVTSATLQVTIPVALAAACIAGGCAALGAAALVILKGCAMHPEDEEAIATPGGRVLSAHYLYDTGPVRNIPVSVVDQTINRGNVAAELADRTVYYDAENDVTVVLSKTTGKVMSAHRGAP